MLGKPTPQVSVFGKHFFKGSLDLLPSPDESNWLFAIQLLAGPVSIAAGSHRWVVGEVFSHVVADGTDRVEIGKVLADCGSVGPLSEDQVDIDGVGKQRVMVKAIVLVAIFQNLYPRKASRLFSDPPDEQCVHVIARR